MSSLSATRVSRLTRYRQLAPSVSVRVCPICLGMMNFGNAFSSSLGDCTKDTAFDILDHFVKQGGNFIDTANGYQQGQSETWLGDWLTCRQNRDEMVIATKYTGLYKQSSSEAWQVNANYGGNGLLAQPGLRQFVVYQGLWNAAARDFERDIIPMCRDEGMGLSEKDFATRETDHDGRSRQASEHDRRVSKVLEDVATTLGNGVTVMQVVLAYVMHKPPYVFPVLGGRKVDHLKGNIESLLVDLTDQQIEQIESEYSFDPGFPHIFLSGTLMKGPDVDKRGAYSPAHVWLTSDSIDFVEEVKPMKVIH